MSKLFILRAGYYLIPSSSFLSPKTGVTLKENLLALLQKQNENCKVQKSNLTEGDFAFFNLHSALSHCT